MNFSKYLPIILIITIMVFFMGCTSNQNPNYDTWNNTTTIQVTPNVSIITYTEPITVSSTIETSTPAPTPQYVTCSNYHKVVDKWKTPDGSYVKLDDNTTVELMPPDFVPSSPPIQLGDDYTNITVGEYTNICESSTDRYDYTTLCTSKLSRTVKLKPVSESESGYRDACEVVS
jgi:hypothetical protein